MVVLGVGTGESASRQNHPRVEGVDETPSELEQVYSSDPLNPDKQPNSDGAAATMGKQALVPHVETVAAPKRKRYQLSVPRKNRSIFTLE